MNEEQMQKLRNYVGLMGDELGEVLYHIISIYDLYRSYISPSLNEEIEKELLDHFNWFEKCTEIEE